MTLWGKLLLVWLFLITIECMVIVVLSFLYSLAFGVVIFSLVVALMYYLDKNLPVTEEVLRAGNEPIEERT